MTLKFDVLILNGNVADGGGEEPVVADVGIIDGKIVAVGPHLGSASTEINAPGMLVTPGFVDIHTHLDGQVTWDNTLRPSSLHGVTTAVMGNCGVGFAPCKPHDREGLIRLMEGVEDIPGAVMDEGLPWKWETFPEYLDFLATRECDIDFATQVPHSPVRVFAMGQRGLDREPPRTDDLEKMQAIVKEAVEAGALGFSTSRTMIHRTKSGQLAPSITASETELTAIALGLKAAGKGSIQMVDDFHGIYEGSFEEFRMIERLVATSGRPVTLSVVQRNDAPDRWRILLDLIDEANLKGLPIVGQFAGRPVGLLFGLDLTTHPFYMCPSYLKIAHLPLAERVRIMKNADFRERLLEEESLDPSPEWKDATRSVSRMYEFGDPPDYAPAIEESLGVRAEMNGTSALELAYDTLLKKQGKAILYFPVGNYAYGNLEPTLEMIRSANTVIGLGDAGAHLGLVCDASMPTHLLTYWTRDRDGERIPLGKAVQMLTSTPSFLIGLKDRGRIAPGYRADINIIDYDNLELGYPYTVSDLPSGGKRLMQDAAGIRMTLKNGVPIYRDGIATGARPGRLVRGEQPAPEL